MSEVTLTLSQDSLRSLPEGAEYHARSGQANVSVRKGKTPETIVVYASCDSLQRQVLLYEEQLSEIRKQSEASSAAVQTVSEKHSSRFPITAPAIGLAVGIVVTIITKKIWTKVF